MAALFAVVRRGVFGFPGAAGPCIAALDDTLVRKTGRKIPGVKYLRDPMSPPFQTNLVKGLRFIQVAAALVPEHDGPTRLVPIAFTPAPVPDKPPKNATDEQRAEYQQRRKTATLSAQGAACIAQLRRDLDQDHHRTDCDLWMVVDGSYTNQTVLRAVPDRCLLIGRIRKDAAFYYPYVPPAGAARGRPRRFGPKAPTPEQLRQDRTLPWRTVSVFAVGKRHEMEVKTLDGVLTKIIGAHHPVRVIAIRPLAYRPRKGSRLLYREPAYLICGDPEAPVAAVVQAYLYRWDIETNKRDVKQLFGAAQARVRNARSVVGVVQFAAAVYGMLLLAAANTFGITGLPNQIPAPKWYRRSKNRASTASLINQFRYELWETGIAHLNFIGFVAKRLAATNPLKLMPNLVEALLNAAK